MIRHDLTSILRSPARWELKLGRSSYPALPIRITIGSRQSLPTDAEDSQLSDLKVGRLMSPMASRDREIPRSGRKVAPRALALAASRIDFELPSQVTAGSYDSTLPALDRSIHDKRVRVKDRMVSLKVPSGLGRRQCGQDCGFDHRGQDSPPSLIP
jgi:hypothetical protein